MLRKKEIPSMTFRKDGKNYSPIFAGQVNGTYIIGVYHGSLSKYDILIKYRQLVGGKWTRIRTPKHIHWAVDLMIKMHSDAEITKQFLSFLIEMWKKIKPLRSRKAQRKALGIESLLKENQKEILKYEKLGKYGEYSIKFLILLAKLLMIQEKTNQETAYFFHKLLKELQEGKDLFKIVSTATHRSR